MNYNGALTASPSILPLMQFQPLLSYYGVVNKLTEEEDDP
jgi:hypothetical protein